MNALDRQVGGDHYKKWPIQPIELINAVEFNFCQGNVLKYVLRHKYKKGYEDLLKAVHYCELATPVDLSNGVMLSPAAKIMAKIFCKVNELDDIYEDIILGLFGGEYYKVIQYINVISTTEYQKSVYTSDMKGEQ